VSLSWYEDRQDKKESEVESKLIYDYRRHVKKVRHFNRSDRFVDLDCSGHNLMVMGDVKLQFYHKDRYNTEKMFQLWFHTAFIENNYLVFEKSVLDKACKDKDHKRFDNSFKLEIFLHKVDKIVPVSDIVSIEAI